MSDAGSGHLADIDIARAATIRPILELAQEKLGMPKPNGCIPLLPPGQVHV